MINECYSNDELKEVQDCIEGGLTGKIRFSPDEITIVREKFKDSVPEHLKPFLRLLFTNPDLYEKVSNDDLIKDYLIFGFFPETFDLVYGSDIKPKIAVAGRNRGRDSVVLLSHPNKSLIIKLLQSSREYEIAKIAAELDLGPKQYKTLIGALTEEFVQGNTFSSLDHDILSQERMYGLGRRIGQIFLKLHSRDIYYNDINLTDDYGHSHIIVPDNANLAVLIDYGVAINLKDHPNLSDEEIFDFARTLPEVNFQLIYPVEERIKRLVIENFRPVVERSTKEEIMARDQRFVYEGVWFAEARFSRNFPKNDFIRGFEEIYKTQI